MEKAFPTGLVLGRFQTFHNGHKAIIDKALQICESTVILIGSSQESGTAKNPYSFDLRKRILETVYSGKSIEIYPLPDIGVGNNNSWGSYVYEQFKKLSGKTPDILISGKEDRRISWFDDVPNLSIAELYLPKTIDISATVMRNHLISGNIDEWKKYTPIQLWPLYKELRNQVIASQNNTETSSI